VDRDVNGALGILLRALGDTSCLERAISKLYLLANVNKNVSVICPTRILEYKMNLKLFFEALNNRPSLSVKASETLQKIMEIQNPMLFSQEYVSDEEIIQLEEEIVVINATKPKTGNIRHATSCARPCSSNSNGFI